MIDSHTHLQLCEQSDAELVAEATAAGVMKMLCVGIDGPSSRKALAAAESFPQVHAAVGCHPNEAKGFDAADLAEIAALADHPRCVAIGETGLDFYRDGAPRADQARAFADHIALARDAGKPLVIHCRQAENEVLDQLEAQAAGVQVIIHCFSMPHSLARCLDAGYAISFAGNVTFKNATELAQAAALVPDEKLLIETDAPYLAPVPKRGRENRPAYVVHTAAFLAQLRGVSVQQLAETVQRNAGRIFRW